MALIALVLCSSALAQSSRDDYLTSLEASLIDDINIEDDVLVVWPSPSLQSSLDYDSLGQRLCGDHKRYWYSCGVVYGFISVSKRKKNGALGELHLRKVTAVSGNGGCMGVIKITLPLFLPTCLDAA